MNWNPQADVLDISSGALESYMDFFESLTYDHVNFIFAGATNLEDAYPSSSINMGYYKSVGYSDQPGLTLCYENDHHSYGFFDHVGSIDEDRRRPVELSSAIPNEQQTAAVNQQQLDRSRSARPTSIDCPRSRHNSTDYQTPWLDNIDPDNMSYEELLELGEAVGTQSRGLSQEQISMLPVSKFKCRFFLRRKSPSERCVICQMEYKRRDRIITLPCKHKYHLGCASKWLNINKACPICYTEVSITAPGK